MEAALYRRLGHDFLFEANLSEEVMTTIFSFEATLSEEVMTAIFSFEATLSEEVMTSASPLKDWL